MGGGLMQLVAYGAQDVYLTSNPQITFWKLLYRRHTNFAMESIEQVFNGQADWGRKVTATVSRNGDLIHRTYLRVELPTVTVNAGHSFRWLNWVGHILIKSVEIEIGGQRIDKHYGDWLHIWNELTQTAGHQIGYANMVGNTPNLTSIWTKPAYTVAGSPAVYTASTATLAVPGQILYIPLEFWWNRNPGLALPLIALQYHEIKLNLELNQATNCYWSGKIGTGTGLFADSGANGIALGSFTTDLSTTAVLVPSLVTCTLFIDYIYLDTDERRRFAQAAHEYLIEQLQYTGDESTSQTNNKIKLSFNHPTKELIWIVQPTDNITDTNQGSVVSGNGVAALPYGKQWFNYTDAYDPTYVSNFIFNSSGGAFFDNNQSTQGSGGIAAVAAGGANGVYVPVSFGDGQNPVRETQLQLNGHERFSKRDGRYFSLVQPYQHHENVPTQGINVYSFALKPEEHQPSGTCNFSRIDTASLNLTLTSATVAGSRSAIVRVYAVNYNVLRIMSGMGGLAYSN
jgi:hypothetical protein